MFNIFLALFLAFACPTHKPTSCHGTTVTTQDAPPPDTGGEGGHTPPDKP